MKKRKSNKYGLELHIYDFNVVPYKIIQRGILFLLMGATSKIILPPKKI